MIIDTCIFAGELEMWWFRHQILEPVVDHFVIVENSWTHQGQPRERTFSNEYDTVHPFFIDVKRDDPKYTEAAHRDAIADCCSQFNDDDLVILSDVDEIPSRYAVSAMEYVDLPTTCELDFYYYRLNWRRPEKCGIAMSTVKHLREIRGNALRSLRGSTKICGGGWHLSYFGGTEAIQKKLKSFCHPEFNQPEFLDEAWLDKCQKEGIALLKCGTPMTKSKPSDFPKYFLDAAPKGWWL